MSSTSCYALLTTLKPLLNGQCVVSVSGTAGVHRKQISFLDLGPSFPFQPSPLPLLPALPALPLATSRNDNMPLLSSILGIFRWKALRGLTWEMRFMSLVFLWGQLDLRVVKMITSGVNARFMMQRNFKLEKQEGYFCSLAAWAKWKKL